jgi:two-component system, OmpR family, response regulator
VPDESDDGVARAGGHGVELVRWPSETARRDRFARDGIPRLLLVEPGADPPPTTDLDEGWMLLPADAEAVEARARQLAASSAVLDDARPWIDDQDRLHRGPAAVPLTAAEAVVARALLAVPGRIVDRSELERRLWPRSGPPSTKAVDAVVYRLRRRVGAAHLHVRTVRSRGFVVDL